MPISYSMPPWVGQPADPAAHYQAGFQMGTHLGAQQAAQMFQQQQLARELQKDEFERQSQSLALQMKVEEAAAQHRANFAYQNMIARGVDPMEALKSVGPDMGIDPTRIMAMQEQRQERAAQQANLAEYRRSIVQQRALDREERGREAAARIQQAKEKAESEKEKPTTMPKLVDLGGKPFIVNEKTGHFEPLEKTVSRAAFISQNVSKWMSQEGIGEDEAAKRLGKFYDQNLAQAIPDSGQTITPSPAPASLSAPIQSSSKFIPGKIYVDAEGHKAMYQQDGTWKEIE